MYGLINNALQSMIRQNYGDEKWQQILERSGVPDDSFLTMRSYDDSITYQLAGAAAEVLGAPIETCLEMFGEYWVLETATKSYGPLMDASGRDMVEFLRNLNALHDRITGTFLNYVPPEFEVEDVGENRYRIHYISQREGLVPFVVGLFNGLAKRFDCELLYHNKQSEDVAQGTHAIFEVSVK
ncbi:guanylyl cyclase [Pseudomaricurvus alkylphenolicus]|nr:guanylyl cyclase [Pseudomaricurvus alkylphenolicus]